MVLQVIPSTRYHIFAEMKLDRFVKMSPYLEFTDDSKVLAHTKKGL